MMLNLTEIGQNIQNTMRAQEVIINIAVVVANFAKKNGREMFLISINS
jgi:hypothetical protein